MKLLVHIPDYLEFVSKTVLQTIEERIENLDFEIVIHLENYYQIEDVASKSTVRLPALFITKEQHRWNQRRSAENWGLDYFSYEHLDKLPVLFKGSPDSSKYHTNIDFLGTVFFLMHRYHEEVEELHKDKFGRISSNYSFLVRNNLHTKPWADIYLDLFINVLNEGLGINLNQKTEFKIQPTHDVDRPFEYFYYTVPRLIKRLGGDLINKKDISSAKRRLKGYLKSRSGDQSSDPLNTFDWIMDQSEREGLQSTFHFISESTNPKYDQDYTLQDKVIRELFKSIDSREHKIGLHPSFGAIDIERQIQKEFNELKEATIEYTKDYTVWKSRNHYLRWDSNTIPELEKSGVDIDQTLGFAEIPGFRCGTSHIFNAFNFKENRVSSTRLEPLIIMEVSLFDKDYLDLGNRLDDAWTLVESLKKECKEHGGNFTILWHNNHLTEDKYKSFYKECLK